MKAGKLKTKFHKFIDGIEDEVVLEYFLGAMSDFASRKPGTDILDELSIKQKKRLKSSLEQRKKGETISNGQMKKEILQWLAK